MTIVGGFPVILNNNLCFQISLDIIVNMSMEYIKDEKIDIETNCPGGASVRDEDQPGRYVCQEAVVSI